MTNKAAINDIGQTIISELKEMAVFPAPECYEVWFKYHRKAHGELTREIDARRAEKKPIDTDFLLGLYYRYCEIVDLAPVFDRYFDKVLEEVDGLKGVAEGLSQSAQTFREDVTTLSADIQGEAGSKTELRGFIAALVETAAAATKRNLVLENKLSAAVESVSNLRESIDEIEQDAHTDFLTKLANRRRFDKFLHEAIAIAEKEGAPLSLIVGDIDHFKRFNDTHGHQVGDHVLKFVADIMKQTIKGQDLAARYGGEEFAIVLPNTALWNAHTVADQIRATICKKKLVSRSGNQDLGSITVSFGVAEFEPGSTGDALFTVADAALYEAKLAGRNKVVAHENLRLRTA